jgi:hypothetical protein
LVSCSVSKFQVSMNIFNWYNITLYLFQKGKIISKTHLIAKGRIHLVGAFI